MSNNICWHQNECIEAMNKAHDQPNNHPHFDALTDLLNHITTAEGARYSLLDIGTGTAAISKYCKNFDFYGADLPHILTGCAMKNYPQYPYFKLDVTEDELAHINKFDVILLNAVIDIMEHPLTVLKRVLTYAKRYVVIHRQEITESGSTKSILKPSYSGQTYHSIVRRSELNSLVEEMGFEIVYENSPGFADWENNGASFLLRNRNFEDKRYEGHPLRQLRNRIQMTDPCKVSLGAGDQPHDIQWICTNVEELDIENRNDWEFLFGDHRADNLLASHLFEHLVQPELAAKNCYDFLKDGGRLRIAVPDGYFPDQDYIDQVKPGGTGAGSDDHRHLWNVDTMTKLLQDAGFNDIIPIEWWDSIGFNGRVWSVKDGFIGRSADHDERNIGGKLNYTSLIIDAVK